MGIVFKSKVPNSRWMAGCRSRRRGASWRLVRSLQGTEETEGKAVRAYLPSPEAKTWAVFDF